MSLIIIPPPYPGPWDTTREGGVRSGAAHLIGYCRYEHLGDTAKMQAASRWWAASPSLVEATIALTVASQLGVRELVKPDDALKALTAIKAAQEQALVAIARLRDPAITDGAGFNAPVTAGLDQLRRGLSR